MARNRPVRVTRPARVGLIALGVIALAVLAFYLTAAFFRGPGGYKTAVRFRQAAGIAPGAAVTLNGVAIGTVTKVVILPDTTVDFFITVFKNVDIPKNAKFVVQSSVTGSPSVAISVPQGAVARGNVWPRRVLPIPQQPQGTQPLSIETFMQQSRSLGTRAKRILAQAKPYGSRMLERLQSTRANAALTMQTLRGSMPSLMSGVQSTIAKAQANVQSARTALAQRDEPKLAATAAAFSRTSADMNRSAAALDELKRDPSLRENVRAATAQLRKAVKNMSALADDMRMVTGNPQTKAELRDAGARLHALLHRL